MAGQALGRSFLLGMIYTDSGQRLACPRDHVNHARRRQVNLNRERPTHGLRALAARPGRRRKSAAPGRSSPGRSGPPAALLEGPRPSWDRMRCPGEPHDGQELPAPLSTMGGRQALQHDLAERGGLGSCPPPSRTGTATGGSLGCIGLAVLVHGAGCTDTRSKADRASPAIRVSSSRHSLTALVEPAANQVGGLAGITVEVEGVRDLLPDFDPEVRALGVEAGLGVGLRARRGVQLDRSRSPNTASTGASISSDRGGPMNTSSNRPTALRP